MSVPVIFYKTLPLQTNLFKTIMQVIDCISWLDIKLDFLVTRSFKQDMFYISGSVLISLLRFFVALTVLLLFFFLNCHCTEQPVPRCSHIKACTGQRCLNTLILSLHSSQTSIATAVATSHRTTASAMFCTQTQREPMWLKSFVRPSKGSWTCSMIERCFCPFPLKTATIH